MSSPLYSSFCSALQPLLLCNVAGEAKKAFRNLFFKNDLAHQQEVRQTILSLGIKTAQQLDDDPKFLNRRVRRMVLPPAQLAFNVAQWFNSWVDRGLDANTGLSLWNPASANSCLNLLTRVEAGRYTGEAYTCKIAGHH